MWNLIEKTAHFFVFGFLGIFHKKLTDSQWEAFMQFVKFGLVGLSNTLLTYVVYAILVTLGLHYQLSNVISYAAGIFNSYYWNNKYVFQEDRLLEHLSAEGNLRFALGREYDAKTARVLLDRLDLPDTGAQPVREFSGGMKRRLALARALLAPFDVLLLDEPFTGLDQENRARALAAIRETAGVRPVLLVTHDTADAEGAPVVRL